MRGLRTLSLRVGIVGTMMLAPVVMAANACEASQASGGGEPAITITMTDQLMFEPKRDTITVGQTVEWWNGSLLVHTVTADPAKATLSESVLLPDGAAAFDSGNLEPDSTFTHAFTVPGTYRYFCIPHEGASMTGEIVVLSN
ncbi:MAG: plastocyanin/azurin family copper-binding protein [Gemmatimonadales bacterium]